MSAPLLWLLA
ncbi:hypothetical protein MKD33_04100, partial [Chromobacterium piscinae]